MYSPSHRASSPSIRFLDYSEELARKRNVLQTVTGTKKAIHSIMVTTDGLTRNEYWGDVQSEIQLDDLYDL